MKAGVSKYAHISPEILRSMRETMTVEQIALHFEIPQGTMSGLLKKYKISGPGKGKYDRSKMAPKVPTGRPPGSEPRRLAISVGQEKFIRENYKTLTRRELAARLGINMVDLNLAMIQLGLGR